MLPKTTKKITEKGNESIFIPLIVLSDARRSFQMPEDDRRGSTI